MISSGLGLVYVVFVFVVRNRLSGKAAKVAEKKKELAPMVSQFLFFEQSSPVEEKKEYLHTKVEIREMIKSDFNRLVLSEILLDLQKDVSGEARENLYSLYQGLGLHHDAFEKLKSRRWEVISQGILELTQMRVEESYMFIRRFINHRRGVVRKQAQIATVTLKNEGISYFLDTCKYRISEWQQLKLLDVLRNFDDFIPPRFKIWLTSKNKDVVLFALRLIRYYNQNDANQAIIQLIKHRNNQIKTEAVQCLKEFGVVEARNTIKAAFRRNTAAIKIAMLDALAEFGNRDDLEFLKKVERSDGNFTVRSKALSAINTLYPENIMPTDDILEPSPADVRFAEDKAKAKAKAEERRQEDIKQLETLSEQIETNMAVTPDKTSIEMEDFVKITELEEEDESIFDLCVQEEFQDILSELEQEDEPQFLPLEFLPLVESKSEGKSIDTESKNTPVAKPKTADEEEKFKQDLSAIINRLAMKEESKEPVANNDIPDFIPLVVESQSGIESSDDTTAFLETEVSAEVVGTENNKGNIENAEQQEPGYVDILNTEVIAEEVLWKKLLAENEIDLQISLDQEEEIEETRNQDFTAFSIFREMFRDFDAESKLILLDEILVVGEYKELCFLATLSDDNDRRIRKKAHKIRQQLAAKLGVSLDPTIPTQEDIPEPSVPDMPFSEQEPVEDEAKLPLEYCFLEGPLPDMEDKELKS